MYLIKPQPYLL